MNLSVWLDKVGPGVDPLDVGDNWTTFALVFGVTDRTKSAVGVSFALRHKPYSPTIYVWLWRRMLGLGLFGDE